MKRELENNSNDDDDDDDNDNKIAEVSAILEGGVGGVIPCMTILRCATGVPPNCPKTGYMVV